MLWAALRRRAACAGHAALVPGSGALERPAVGLSPPLQSPSHARHGAATTSGRPAGVAGLPRPPRWVRGFAAAGAAGPPAPLGRKGEPPAAMDAFDVMGGVQSQVLVEEYDARGFKVNDVELRGAVLLLPSLALLWRPQRLADATADSLACLSLLKQPPEILLLGCGDRMGLPPPSLRADLRDRGIVLDVMDTPNAISTFNILAQEGRRVAAALLPIGGPPPGPG